MLVGRLANAKASTDTSATSFEERFADLEACAKAGSSHLRAAQRWFGASFATAAVAVVVLLAQAWVTKPAPAVSKAPAVGATLPGVSTVQAAEAKAPPVVMPPQDLPPCRSGANECKPWEREWSESPAIGTVVLEPRTDGK